MCVCVRARACVRVCVCESVRACHQSGLRTAFSAIKTCFLFCILCVGAGSTVSFVSLNIFACQRHIVFLTVRPCSFVEEQLSRLDYNGKHIVRLVTKH